MEPGAFRKVLAAVVDPRKPPLQRRRLTDIGGAGQTTLYAYDNIGNAVSIQDALTRVTTQAFDALNRLTTITQPSTGVTARQYDPGDKLTSVTDSNTPSQLRQ